MCYAIPGQVIRIQDKIVTVEYFGEEKKAINELENLQIGDYIYAQGGYVINKITEIEAKDILSVWKETFFELQEVDLRLSRLTFDKNIIDKKVSIILDKALENVSLSKDDFEYLLRKEDENTLQLIYKTANFLRQKYLKNSCCVHGIIEISNYCRCRCMYCGISRYNKTLTRYKMTAEEIAAAAVKAVTKFGFKALVLQGGEGEHYSIDELAGVIRKIKKEAGVLICVSFGEVGAEGLQKLYDAGARAILLRFETSNPQLYAKFHPQRNLDSRLFNIKKAYQIGYLIITGALIGLPGQTPQDIINDIFLAKELNAEMYSFGPFLPHPHTPLGSNNRIDSEEIFKTLALIRLLDPQNGKILVTTALETLNPEARRKGLLSGANSVMINVTPLEYRKQYEIYPDRMHRSKEISVQIEETISLLISLGRSPTDLGIS